MRVFTIMYKFLWRQSFLVVGTLIIVSIPLTVYTTGVPDIFKVTFLVELVIPLLVGLTTAHLVLIDRELDTAEIVYTTSTSRLWLLISRAGTMLCINLILGLLIIMVLWIIYPQFSIINMWTTFIAPLVFLSAISLTTANITKSISVGYIFPLILVVSELYLRDIIPKNIYLFYKLFALAPDGFLLNRLCLIAIGIALFALNWLILEKTRWVIL